MVTVTVVVTISMSLPVVEGVDGGEVAVRDEVELDLAVEGVLGGSVAANGVTRVSKYVCRNS